mmetsp:Transcript_15929/g.32644  ORF Transcript_15929/g.32644 Transcript_15929/m.32644 type:complete len:179 (+) Transcript_15929:1-537(+)
MNGYWQRGKKENNRNLRSSNSNNNKTMVESSTSNHYDNHWFISSDLGFWDDQGRLCFGGRAKDVVRTGGETVLAREVEQVVLDHPDVAECAIFPRKDHRYGEAVACAIVLKNPRSSIQYTGSLSNETIKKWCQQRGLAGYKRPKIVFLVDSLPRNSSGKILKHKLVSRFGNEELQSKL